MNALYCWDFRQNMSDISQNDLRLVLKGLAKKWVFQGEQGKKTGYKHWQGRISLFKKVRKSTLLNLFKKTGWKPPQFLEPTVFREAVLPEACGGRGGNFNYQLKTDTRICGPWSDKDEAAFIPKQYKLQKLRKWQESIRNSLTMWDNRKINVIIDEAGNKGKTTIAHYCKLHLGGVVIPAMNDSDKLIQAACCILKGMEQRKSCLMFIDMPRAMNQKKCGQMYTAIETLKGGWSYDWRNHWKEWYMDSPIIWVFTNTLPELSYITKDRWSLWEINKKQELQKYGKYKAPSCGGEGKTGGT